MKMKRFSGLFFVVCLFGAVIAFPTSDLDDEAEIVVVPLEAQREKTNDQRRIGTDDIGSPFFTFAPYNPFRWNFGFFDEVQSDRTLRLDRKHPGCY